MRASDSSSASAPPEPQPGAADRIIVADSPSAVPSAASGPPPDPARAAQPGAPSWRDLIAILLVAALAILLASFPARNADPWVHLAAGRSLAHGDLRAVMAPPAPDGTPVSRAWPYDLLCYGLHSAFGGPYSGFGGVGLAAMNALLAALLAVVLWLLCRGGSGAGAAVLCTALTLLVVGARLLLQPATVSYLLLALTLLLLRRREQAGRDRPPSFLPPWQLAALFVLWVNIDGGFLAGLGVVGLTWLGEVVDGAGGGREGWAAALLRRGASLAALAAACLLNPWHVYAYGDAVRELGGAVTATSAAASRAPSPFEGAYLAVIAASPAGLAYYPLLALSGLSFLALLPRWPWRRFLPWLGLAALSALQARAVPFFAVWAGPMLAWNLQEAVSRQPSSRRTVGPAGVVAGYVLAAAAGLAVLACAWPGWLQGPPFEPRRWAVEPPPSVERGAAAVRRWRDHGQFGADARGLHLSPETAAAFSWFCPDDGAALDRRLAASLLGGSPAEVDWAGRMRAAGANHVIVYDRDPRRLLPALTGLLADPRQWPLLYEEGDLAIFGWRDPAAGATADPFRGMEVDLDRLAFHPADDKKAPAKPPARGPGERPWWDALWRSAPPRPVDREEALLYLAHADALREPAAFQRLAAWHGSQIAALIGAAGGWTDPADLLDERVRVTTALTQAPQQDYSLDAVPVPEQWALFFQQAYAAQHDATPPALLYLAVRAARRAVAANPDDALAYQALGEAYLRLLHNTREHVRAARLPELRQLRYAQAAAALSQAIALKPDLLQARLSLGRLYLEMEYLDLALEEFQTYRKLAFAQGAAAEIGPELVDALAKDVQARIDSFTLQSSGKRALDRAGLAFQMHLAGKARQILLESDIAAFGQEGAILELTLLLRTGRAKDAADWTGPDLQTVLDASTYHWVRAQALAATGNYAAARVELVRLAPSQGLGDEAADAPRYQKALAMLVGQRVLDEAAARGTPYQNWQPLFGRADFMMKVGAFADDWRQEANWTVLWGLLALEQGETDDARFAFQKALDVWGDEATATRGGGLDFEARPIAQAGLEWVK